MIETLPDAFEYVNQRYIFNAENYPVMAKLTERENTIFALKHGLLHTMKSFDKLGYEVHTSKVDTHHLHYLALPDEELYSLALDFKKANLKMVINVLSMCHIVGITKEKLSSYKVPNEEEMNTIHGNNDTAVSFRGHVRYLMEALAGLLESADHSSDSQLEKIVGLAYGYVEELYLCTLYWFDDVWVPGFLNEIPTVMKSE